jgi:hypothetical protein
VMSSSHRFLNLASGNLPVSSRIVVSSQIGNESYTSVKTTGPGLQAAAICLFVEICLCTAAYLFSECLLAGCALT